MISVETVNIINAYAPYVGLEALSKEKFWEGIFAGVYLRLSMRRKDSPRWGSKWTFSSGARKFIQEFMVVLDN